MGHENLYGNVDRVFRSGPDSIYLYTNTILNIIYNHPIVLMLIWLRRLRAFIL